jgi:hypothetical protein
MQKLLNGRQARSPYYLHPGIDLPSYCGGVQGHSSLQENNRQMKGKSLFKFRSAGSLYQLTSILESMNLLQIESRMVHDDQNTSPVEL